MGGIVHASARLFVASGVQHVATYSTCHGAPVKIRETREIISRHAPQLKSSLSNKATLRPDAGHASSDDLNIELVCWAGPAVYQRVGYLLPCGSRAGRWCIPSPGRQQPLYERKWDDWRGKVWKIASVKDTKSSRGFTFAFMRGAGKGIRMTEPNPKLQMDRLSRGAHDPDMRGITTSISCFR